MESKRLEEFKKLREKDVKWKNWYSNTEILDKLKLTGQLDKINRLVYILENDKHISKDKKFNLIVWNIPDDRWDFLKDMVRFSIEEKGTVKYGKQKGKIKPFDYSSIQKKIVKEKDREARKYVKQAKIYEKNKDYADSLKYFEKAQQLYLTINNRKNASGLERRIHRIKDLRDDLNKKSQLYTEAEELFKLAEKYRANKDFDDAITCYKQAKYNYSLLKENRTVQDLDDLIEKIQELIRKKKITERSRAEKEQILNDASEILYKSSEISLEQFMVTLKMDNIQFNQKITEWSRRFGFKITGSLIIINKTSDIDGFIKLLANYLGI
jgi:tetratricopeptide (TPR) repeat protein